MPILEVGDGYFADFKDVPLATANGEIVVLNDSLIKIKTEAGYENYIGRYTFSAEGLPLGTIDTYKLVSFDGKPIYSILNANIDVLELRETSMSGNKEDLLKLIFRSNDTLVGNSLDDKMLGYTGKDTMEGRGGDDTLHGVQGDDRLRGDDGNDVLLGGAGRDRLYGGEGSDWLDGGKDANFLTGGGGPDVFAFRAADGGNRITDFGLGDRIALGLPGLGPRGGLDPARFHIGSHAETPAQKIVYDSDTGWVLYARDGSNTANPVKLVEIGPHLHNLAAHDFFVI